MGLVALILGTVLVLLMAMIYFNLNKVSKGDTTKEKTVEKLAIFTVIWIVITIFFFSSF
jgi:heme/copper-type cytochrome/quinol oxidase subunit 2